MSRRSLATSGGLVAAVVLAAGAVTLLPGATPPAAADVLVPYAGCGELLGYYRSELARRATAHGSIDGGGGFLESADSAGPVPVAARAQGGADELGAVGAGPTGTNVQERGVDEPDTAKTVDGLLYVVARNRLQVLSTGADPELLSSLPLGEQAYGAELLVQGDRVLVVVPTGDAYGIAVDLGRPSLGSPIGSFPVGGGAQATRLVLVDVADPRDPRVLEELELGGRYLSARLADGAVRVVTSSTPIPRGTSPQPPYGPAQERAALTANVRAARAVTLDEVLPRNVRRTADGRMLSDERAVGCDDVRYAPSSQGASTLLVTTLDPSRDLAPQDSTGVTTDGELVYASTGRLYVATSRWGTSAPPVPLDDRRDTATATVVDRVTTELHAFDVSSPTSTRYAGSASVDGYVMGRWALSSYDGHLRVATTSSPPWGPGPLSSSQVTVLQEQPDGLVETGRVDGLGVGERIYAVRYFGELATVVTFRQTDPLYVLDLADPAAPRLLGELKVPGFSTYLHPVGRDRLLGVGQDADDQGRVTGTQLSLFDLSDRRRPVQLDRLSLGQGHTPAEGDSRAFGFDAVRGTALLPFETYTQTGGTSSALAVRVTAEGALVQAGRLTVALQAPVVRVLHDADHVYAVTQEGVVAASAGDLRRTGEGRFAG